MAAPIVTPDRIGALVDQWRQSQNFERELAERLAGLLERELETFQRRMAQYKRLIEELEKGLPVDTPAEAPPWQEADTPPSFTAHPHDPPGFAARPRDYPRYY